MPRTLESPFLDAESFARDDASGWDAPAVSAAETGTEDSLNAFELFDEVRELWTQEEPELEAGDGENPDDTHDESEASEFEDGENKCSESGHGIVGTNDDRVKVIDSVAVPYRWICQLWVRRRDSTGKVTDTGGTGVLISPRHVLTCAHVVREDQKDNRNQWVSYEAIQIRVSPGRDGSDRPFGTYDVKLPAQLSPGWNPRTKPHGFDYALLTLDKAVGDDTFKALGGKKLGYWGSKANGAGSSFRRVPPDSLNGRVATTAGYPGDKGKETPYVTDGTIQMATLRSRTMNISADACKGQSGSPIWLTVDNDQCLVGLMVAVYRGTNMALRVTDELCAQLRTWMKGASDACAPRPAASGTVRPQPELESPARCRCHEHEADDLEAFADEYSAGELIASGEYQLDDSGDLAENEGWDEADEFEEPEDESAFVDGELDPMVLDIAERVMRHEAPFLEGQAAKNFTTCFSTADVDRVKQAYDANNTAATANDGDRCSCIVMLNVALGALLPIKRKENPARSTSSRSVSMAALTTDSIEKAMQQLRTKGLAAAPTIMNFFDRRNRTAGTLKPERLKASVQDKVLALSKTEKCWFAYGLSIMDGYHSVLLVVDRTAGATKIYWLDQFSTGLHDHVTTTLDQRITERTQTWWQGVMDKKNKGYDTTIRIWPLRKPRKP